MPQRYEEQQNENGLSPKFFDLAVASSKVESRVHRFSFNGKMLIKKKKFEDIDSKALKLQDLPLHPITQILRLENIPKSAILTTLKNINISQVKVLSRQFYTHSISCHYKIELSFFK